MIKKTFNNRTWGFPRAAQENQEVHRRVQTADSQPTAHSPGLPASRADSLERLAARKSPGAPGSSREGLGGLQYHTLGRRGGGGHHGPAQYLLKPGEEMFSPQRVPGKRAQTGHADPSKRASEDPRNPGPAGVEGRQLPSNLRPRRRPAHHVT